VFNHHRRLCALAVTVHPDFVVDDHAEVVEWAGRERQPDYVTISRRHLA
jgi:hypothetical protein